MSTHAPAHPSTTRASTSRGIAPPLSTVSWNARRSKRSPSLACAAREANGIGQPMHRPAAAQLAHVSDRIALAIGNDPERPAWKPGNFFGEKFGTWRTR